MAKLSPYETGELTDSIFFILMATAAPIHGYGIMKAVQEATEQSIDIGPATMYTTLKKLNQTGWISEVVEEESKILYKITEAGQKILSDNFERRKKIVDFAKKIMGGTGNGEKI